MCILINEFDSKMIKIVKIELVKFPLFIHNYDVIINDEFAF